MDLTPQQILDISKGDVEIASFISTLLSRIVELETRVLDLERQLGKNSRNSSKPPSSDGFRKPTNSRQSGGKKGAPKGHTGHTLRMSDTPDEIIVLTLGSCPHCATSLEAVEASGHVKRQVLDIPLPRPFVTEHQAEEKRCPCCRTMQHASFPKGVNAPVQYGEGFAAWTAYFSVYQMLPLERIAQLFADLTGQRPSEATLLSLLESTAHAAKTEGIPVIRENLRKVPLVHTDETGMRIDNKQHWLHVVSNSEWTLMETYRSRGTGAIEGMGILDTFNGVRRS
jgi:transposase